MADVNEQMDEMLGSSYSDDTTTKMPLGFDKVQRKLRAVDYVLKTEVMDKSLLTKKMLMKR